MEKEDPKLLEQKAYEALAGEKYHQAFTLYQKAANIYQGSNRHKQAAFCFASAASCWSKKSGEAAFYNAALSYEAAAREAEQTKDLEYAAMLYKYAAINYERDREFINFSDCFYRAKESYRRFLMLRLIRPRKIPGAARSKERKGIVGALIRFFVWLGLSFSWLVWGHGERPVRTFYSGILIIILSALIYTGGELLNQGAVIKPDLWQAFYFSVITFTTVGYGDFTPLGMIRLAVVVEALCGLFMIPLFMIGLSRKYLRV